jgi:hypothetical protein
MSELAFHWLVVGYVSPAARKSITDLGGRVDEISHEPPFILVGLAHDPAGYWSISHGQRQHRAPFELWNSGEIQMEHITLQWGPRMAECYSVEETYLIEPDEEYESAKKQVKEREETLAPVSQASSGKGDDFDPFLDSDDLP